MARTHMEEYMCKQIADEQFIVNALDYCENRPFNVVSVVKQTIEDLLKYDKMSDFLQDYCIEVLAYNPEPRTSYVRNYYSQWNENDRR